MTDARPELRVLIADDQPLVRLGFRMLLDAEPDMRVVGEAADGRVAIDQTRELEPDVVLMDIRMPVLDGVQATEGIVASGSRAGVLVVTTFDLDELAFAALRAGASGFLLKDAHPEELLRGLRSVAAGDAVVAPRVTRQLLNQVAGRLPTSPDADVAEGSTGQITDRERDVVVLVARGLTNSEIAAELVLSEATVKGHIGRLLSKLGLRDRVQIVIWAYRHGLADPSGAAP